MLVLLVMVLLLVVVVVVVVAVAEADDCGDDIGDILCCLVARSPLSICEIWGTPEKMIHDMSRSTTVELSEEHVRIGVQNSFLLDVVVSQLSDLTDF